ncbi:MAG: hydantoinase B/oxoprolinase family protein [Rhodospirillales bacterium]|nr:hydantoinase B/oxoprolinase family protein [Rhodospirillales bacterium]
MVDHMMDMWLTMWLTSFMTTYDPTMAMNAGLYRSISVTVPPGIILNAQFPDAVGVRSAPGRRTNDVLTGAIFKAAPHLMSAPTCGASTPFVLAEHIPEEGGRRQVMVVQPMKGGMGALKGQDGVDARDNTLNNMKNHPNETVEEEAGVIVRAYDVRCDSGGPGRWRGGAGQMITVEIVRDGGTILARSMERMRFAPWGVAGGCPGRPQRAVYNLGRADERELGKIDQLPVKAGDTVSFLMAGAAGYGNPYRRPPNRVLADVEQGFVSRAGAARDYGVVITDDGVDQGATKRLRATRGRRAGFDFGRERRAWESVFDDATMLDLNRRLYSLPKSVRYETRRRIFAQAVPDLPAAGAGRSLADVLADPRAVRARLAKILKTEFGAAQDRAAD